MKNIVLGFFLLALMATPVMGQNTPSLKEQRVDEQKASIFYPLSSTNPDLIAALRAKERSATLKSRRNDISDLHSDGAWGLYSGRFLRSCRSWGKG